MESVSQVTVTDGQAHYANDGEAFEGGGKISAAVGGNGRPN